MIPIPFLGWVMEDEEDLVQMLRQQIEIQQGVIRELEVTVKMAQDECSALIKQLGEEK